MSTRLARALRTRGAERGASAVEYGLILVAIAAVIMAVVFIIGSKVRADYSAVCTNWNTAAAESDACS